jgi:hypothetical protein
MMGQVAKATAERLAPPGAAVRVELDVQTHDRYGLVECTKVA